tara:strand:+ start:87 stop:356 length:270 start_codon:yes stop_codon:yes gene_type:complete
MEKKETIFCGNGKEVVFNDGGSIVNFSLALDKIKDHVYEYDGKRYINLTICKNKDGANEYGKTHYVKVNDFKPEDKKETVSSGGDSLPF